LRQKGFEEFLPLYRAKRFWSDRIKLARTVKTVVMQRGAY
jgi:hypothetical protein